MKRRTLLKNLCLFSLALIPARASSLLAECQSETELPQELKQQLVPYFNEAFRDLSKGKSTETLLKSLTDKGALSGSQLALGAIQELAQTEELLEVGGMFYTSTEVELSILSYLNLQDYATVVTLLPGVDLAGGDFKAIANSSAHDCAEECRTNEKCHAYTYAKPSHPIPIKRRRCWLKGEGFTYARNGNYASGIKP